MRTFLWFKRHGVMCCIFLFSLFVFSGCQAPWAKPAPAGLQVQTQPAGASVFLNGEFVNKTPYIDKELKAGKYTLRIEPQDPNLASYETTVMLTENTLTVLNWEFGALPDTSGGVLYEMKPANSKQEASLSVLSVPDGGIVKVDDVSQGFTPTLQTTITPGSHALSVALPSFIEQRHTVNIVSGFAMNVTVKLAKEELDQTLDASSSAQATGSATVATASAKPTTKPSSTPKASGAPSPTPKSTPAPTATTSSSTGSATIAKPYVTIKTTPTGFLRVREEPSTSGKELAQVKPTTSHPYKKTSDDKKWYQIEYEKGKTGWVSGEYATLVE